jgi:pyruvate kinase
LEEKEGNCQFLNLNLNLTPPHPLHDSTTLSILRSVNFPTQRSAPLKTIDIVKLLVALDRLQARIGMQEQSQRKALQAVDPTMLGSARNLVAFLTMADDKSVALRREFSLLGLRFPDEVPSQINVGIQRIRKILDSIASKTIPPETPTSEDDIVAARSRSLLGVRRPGLGAHIVVTLPDDALTDTRLIESLLRAGMSVARINCGQNTSEVWKAVIDNVRRASRTTGVPCRILMDLSGPKLRTGKMMRGPRIIRIRPDRDELGRTTKPAKVWLGAAAGDPGFAYPVLPVSPKWLQTLRFGSRISFVDLRGKKRSLIVGRAFRGGRFALVHDTALLQTGTVLKYTDPRGKRHTTHLDVLPCIEAKIELKPGDTLRIHKAFLPGESARRDARGRCTEPAHISCTMPEVFGCVRRGEPVVFDNGIAEGIITRTMKDEFLVRIHKISGASAKLRAEKGINLPRTRLRTTGLTAKDRKDLRFTAKYADLVSLSFIRNPSDVHALVDALARLKSKKPGMIVKIETLQAAQQLCAIFLAAMRYPRTGIMAARGDLAVEAGWESLPGLQESLSRMCDAAQLPFLVATQILETMTRKGIRSRAEIIDAAGAARGQGILLNKGDHVVSAVHLLAGILRASNSPDTKISEF